MAQLQRLIAYVLVIVTLIVSAVMPQARSVAQAAPPVRVAFTATPVGKTNGFEGAVASAVLHKQEGWIVMSLKLPEGYKVPEKTVFEGWLIDNSPLQSDLSNAFDKDEVMGPRYANRTLATLVNALPYWLSLGAFVDDGSGTLMTAVRWPNYNFGPYDAVGITVETDGNETPWDPRPGGGILYAELANAQPTAEPVLIDSLVGPMPDLGAGQGIRLAPTALADAAKLGGITGRAIVLIEAAAATVSVTLPQGVTLPEGAVLEAFVADGGKLGNFGPSNAHNTDNKLGPAGNNAYISGLADAIPFATSLGVLKADDQGVFRLQVHWPKYAFRVYDIVMVTLETDGNKAPWNPRPGTPVLVGPFSPRTDTTALLATPGDE